MQSHEFQLFKTKRFCPLFITQFLGAFNDNLFKTSLIMLIAFSKNDYLLNPNTLINLAALLFILPYFLFSALAGSIADKFEKSKLIVITKWGEVLIVLLATIGLFLNNLWFLLITLFLLGTQATFFGPLKYSILPQHLQDQELLGGNGLIEMGTFIAILLGTIAGGILIALPNGIVFVSLFMIINALLGLIASFYIPEAKTFVDHLPLNLNPIAQTFRMIKTTYQNSNIFYAVVGISWFWFFGSIFLTQTPNFVRSTLGGTEQAATLLLTSFSIGIGTGSVLCEWLTNKKIDTLWVLVGLSLLTLFAFDLSLISEFSINSKFSIATLKTVHSPTSQIFISDFIHWRILCDGLLMGVFGGIYLVPLYTLIQKQSSQEERSRMIAANNIFNAFFMVCASLFAILLLNLQFSIPELFALTAFLNIFIGIYLRKLRGYSDPQGVKSADTARL